MAFDLFHLASPHRARGQTLADIISGLGGLAQGAGNGLASYAQQSQQAGQDKAVANYMGGGQAQGAAPLTGQVAGMNAPGAGGSTGAGGGAAFPQDKSAIIDQLRQYAGAAKLDPTQTNQYIASAMAESGGKPGVVGDAGSSFGLHQGHVGGLAGGGNAVPGLGDTFMQQTGMTLDQFKSPQGQQAFEQWVAQNWSKYGNPDIFHAMRTPAYQHALASLQGGGGTTPSAAPQPGAAQPQGQPQQGGMDRVRSEFQRFQQSSGLPPGQAWQAFSQHVMPALKQQEQLSASEQRLGLAGQNLDLKKQQLAEQKVRDEEHRRHSLMMEDLGSRTADLRQTHHDAQEKLWDAQIEKIKGADGAAQAKQINATIGDMQKYVVNQRSMLAQYQQAINAGTSKPQELQALYGDPNEYVKRINATEAKIEELRKSIPAAPAPAPPAAPQPQKQTYNGAPPPPQQKPQGEGGAPVKVQSPEEAAKLPPGTLYQAPDGKTYRR